MRSKLIILFIVFSVSNIFAQTDSLNIHKDITKFSNKIDSLSSRISELEMHVSKIDSINNYIIKTRKFLFQNLDKNNKKYKRKIISIARNQKELEQYIDENLKVSDDKRKVLHEKIDSNTSNISSSSDELDNRIAINKTDTSKSIKELDKVLSNSQKYWIVAVIVILLIVLLVIVIFIVLRKLIYKQKQDLISNIENTRKGIEEESVRLDSKLIEVLNTQLKIAEAPKPVTSTQTEEKDHKLALKVADEIIRIQKNLSKMDEKTKGLKQLKRSVESIKNNFASNGYELVEMLGKKFNEGMKVSANFVPDEDLEEGEQVISKIIKPQVNYNGVMIQTAQIEVSQG